MKRDSNHTIEPLAPSLLIFVIRGQEKRSSTEFSCLPSVVERKDRQFQFHCIVKLLCHHPLCLRSRLKKKEELKPWELNCGQHRMILDSPTRTRQGLFCVSSFLNLVILMRPFFSYIPLISQELLHKLFGLLPMPESKGRELWALRVLQESLHGSLSLRLG